MPTVSIEQKSVLDVTFTEVTTSFKHTEQSKEIKE
jgi:hypothetical protein